MWIEALVSLAVLIFENVGWKPLLWPAPPRGGTGDNFSKVDHCISKCTTVVIHIQQTNYKIQLHKQYYISWCTNINTKAAQNQSHKLWENTVSHHKSADLLVFHAWRGEPELLETPQHCSALSLCQLSRKQTPLYNMHQLANKCYMLLFIKVRESKFICWISEYLQREQI